ncbi:MAG: NADH-quinone oxidoreductase subunit J [Gemmatimonadota bacterium]
MTEVVFYCFAAVAVLSALLCITQRNPVWSAIWLVQTMLALAALYVLLGAQFIGAIQVLVYAGAVMVLFLFVIMLLNLGHATSDLRAWPVWVITLGFIAVLAVELLPLMNYSSERMAYEMTRDPKLSDPAVVFQAAHAAQQAAVAQGAAGSIAGPLFGTYLAPFEITSVLLLAALVGAVVLAKRRV